MQHGTETVDAAIERELASYKFLEPEHRPAMKAYLQFVAGVPVDQRCPVCKTPIVVETPGPEVWLTHCPCGKSNSSQKGL
jgi:hypothetical protein